MFYPNPFKAYFNVQIDRTGRGKLILYDRAGYKMLERNVDCWANEPARVDVSHLNTGAYLLKFEFPNAKTITATIIKTDK